MQNNKSNKKCNGNIVYLYSYLTRFYSSIPLCLDLYTLVILRYYAVIGTSAAVYISCHVVLHTVVRPCVVFCACFIFYNNILIK